MVLKLSAGAGETLNDLILHRLQHEGLQQAEALETAFYDQFHRMLASPEAQSQPTRQPLPDYIQLAVLNEKESFALAYQSTPEQLLVLDICHSSRYAHLLNT